MTKRILVATSLLCMCCILFAQNVQVKGKVVSENEAVEFANFILPVSYTHLDVYKRQIHILPLIFAFHEHGLNNQITFESFHPFYNFPYIIEMCIRDSPHIPGVARVRIGTRAHGCGIRRSGERPLRRLG